MQKKFWKSAGFTLAEIIIVLGLIGIVAELTLPGLISNVQKEIFRSQFKKAYSALNQMVVKAEGDLGFGFGCFYWVWEAKQQMFGFKTAGCDTYDSNGDCTHYTLTRDDGSTFDFGTSSGLPANWNGISDECSTFSSWFASNMNIVKYCASQAYTNGCIPYYNGIDTIKTSGGMDSIDANKATSGIKKWRQTNILNNSEAYIFKDGSILIVANKFKPPIFLVDINGKQKPNKWGHDLFGFIIQGQGINAALKVICVSGGADNLTVEDGGKTCTNMYKQAFSLPTAGSSGGEVDDSDS